MSAAHLSYCGETAAAAAMLMRAIEGNYCSYPAMESDSCSSLNLRMTTTYGAIRAAGQACQEEVPQQNELDVASRTTYLGPDLLCCAPC